MKIARQNKPVKKEISRWAFDCKLSDAIKILQEEQAAIPEEYRAGADFEIDDKYEYGDQHINAVITYYIPETDEEMAQRAAAMQATREQQEADQRAEYKRLKAKFEPST